MRLRTQLKIRFIGVLVVLWCLPMMLFICTNGGVFLQQFGKKPLDYSELTYSEVRMDRAVRGSYCTVYDTIGKTYDESRMVRELNDNYVYWLVNCGEDSVMLVRTTPGDTLSSQLYDIVRTSSYTGYVDLDGVFIRNDASIAKAYYDWAKEASEYDKTWNKLMLAPFTLDCTRSYERRLLTFYAGIAMLTALIAAIPAIFIIRKRKSRADAAFYSAYSRPGYETYQSNSAGSYQPQSRQEEVNNYNPYNTYRQQSGSYNGSFQTQGGQACYDPYYTFRSSDVRTSNSFQSQGRPSDSMR